MTLKLGIHALPMDCTYEDLQRVWRLADSSGIYWVSVCDHFIGQMDVRGPQFEGISIMTALAAETSNVRVGCLVFGMGYRNPAQLAKAAVTIDHVSDGRLELGVGAGWYELEHTSYGLPFPPVGARMDVLEEGVQVIKSMLSQKSTTFSGNHFQVEDACSSPAPVQKSPRVWVGGLGERRTLRIVARHADGWNATGASPEVFRHKRRVLEKWCEVEGRDPTEISRSANVGFYMGVDNADADRRRREFREFYGDLADGLEGAMLFGTPAEAIDRIGDYGDAGAEGVNISMTVPFRWDALQAFVEEVVPAFD